MAKCERPEINVASFPGGHVYVSLADVVRYLRNEGHTLEADELALVGIQYSSALEEGVYRDGR